MKYYAILKTKYFFDPHGTPDEGGFTIECLTEDEINENEYTKRKYNANIIKEGVEYLDSWPENGDIPEKLGDKEYYDEDGYNREKTFFKIKEITEAQFIAYKYHVEEYNRIVKHIDE